MPGATEDNNWRTNATQEDVVVESWGQGFVFGALMIMACVTVANMRRRVLLHKLILAELLCAMMHGTFCFMAFKGYDWYLSSTAALLYISSWIHNVVAWLKIRPFFLEPNHIFNLRTGKIVAKVYLSTLVLSLVPISVQIVNNFEFFNNINTRYAEFRPFETLMRDPWWVFTCITVFHVIRKCYGAGVLELIGRSPRFGILLVAIALAMIFTAMDIVSSVHTHMVGRTNGINPWWKLYLVFKCLTDTIMLDDFKTELRRLSLSMAQNATASAQAVMLDLGDVESPVLQHSSGAVRSRETFWKTPRLAFRHDGIKISQLSMLQEVQSGMEKPTTWYNEDAASNSN